VPAPLSSSRVRQGARPMLHCRGDGRSSKVCTRAMFITLIQRHVVLLQYWIIVRDIAIREPIVQRDSRPHPYGIAQHHGWGGVDHE
jgi:hypothetical protein